MATLEEIGAMARSVVERANDLRALEVLTLSPIGLTPEDVSSYGDTGVDAWNQWRSEIPEQDINGTLDDFTGKDTSRFGTEFDYIENLFLIKAYGNNEDHQNVLDGLEVASKALDPVEVDVVPNASIEAIQGLNDNWTGDFPDTFRGRFANKLAYPILLQKRIIQNLAAAVKGHWSLVEGNRESLLDLLTNTEAALTNAIHSGFNGEYMNQGGSEIDGAKVFTTIMSIIGATTAIIGAVAAIPETGGASVAFALTMINTTKTGIETFKTVLDGIEVESNVEPKSTPITGTTVDEILSSMHDALVEISLNINIEQQDMNDRLKNCLDTADELLGNTDPNDQESFLIQPYRMAAIDSPPQPGTDQFNHSS